METAIQTMATENCTPKSPLDKAVRDHLKVAMHRKDRIQIAEELSRVVGQKITLQQLNEWSAPAGGRRISAFLVRPFCEVVGDDRLQRFIMGRRLRDLVRLGEVELEKKGLLRTFGRRRDHKKRRSCRK